ncbi:MAG: hypothetical protein K9W43_13300 [Candidatus Thorarchaeota archaeon]|nr:hypothetical protein [Candidatus Thorarchaeota archaeon]
MSIVQSRTATKRRIYQACAIGIICAALVSATIVVMTQNPITPESGVFNIGTNEAKSDYQITPLHASPAKTSLELFRAEPFRATDEWKLDSSPLSFGRSNIIRYGIDQNGSTFEIVNSRLTFGNRINVPIEFLDSLRVTIQGRLLAGACKIALESSLQNKWTDISSDENTTRFQEPGTFEVTVDAPVSETRLLTEQWACMIGFYVTIDIETSATIKIESVTVTAHATQPLIPATLNVLSSDGENIFNNSASRNLAIWPGLNMTLNTTSTSALIYPRRVNDTVYLPIDTFQCSFGWHRGGCFLATSQTFNFTTSQTTSRAIEVTVPTTRLYLDIAPKKSLEWMIFGEDAVDSIYHRIARSPTMVPDFVYLPDIVTIISVLLTVKSSDHVYWYQSYTPINASYTWRLSVHWPIFDFAGFGMSAGSLFLVVFTISILVVLMVHLQRAAAPFKLRSFLSKKGNLSITLLLLSYLTPWYGLHQSYFAGGLLGEKTELIFIALNLMLTFSTSEFAIFWSPPLSPTTILIEALLWLPVIYWIYCKYINKFNERTFTVLLTLPVAISIITMLVANLDVAWGLLLAIGAFVIYLKDFQSTQK